MKPDRRPTPKQDERNTGNTGPNRPNQGDDKDREFDRGNDRDIDRGGGKREDDRGRTGGTGGGPDKQR